MDRLFHHFVMSLYKYSLSYEMISNVKAITRFFLLYEVLYINYEYS